MESFLNDSMDQIMQAYWNMPIIIVCTIVALGIAIFYEWQFGEWPQVTQLKLARSKIQEAIEAHDCAPILVRLAWHDSGTYDKNRAELGWPEAGGAIGSIRTKHELFADPNAGLQKALSKYLSPIKESCPLVSWADLLQLASATAIESSGGPVVPMRYGRLDGVPEDPPASPFGLPDARAPFGGPPECAKDPVKHLKWVFGKYGMGDKDIVALSGAHTLGRAFADRSGTVPQGSSCVSSGGRAAGGTKFTAKGFTDGHTGYTRKGNGAVACDR
mmetsp:Transcript_5404/g.10268  ORF Transcript_5404/g.10268 Transcript_5404/m.10268 type:complete len:273 (-) Transcript_5404:969-1787(-)